ncbi:MAG: phosphoethanolamine--lipid A transferase, partial [Gammaproteobacteria bacterium]|nr:phosphoethanolamine--lipid A transferase [Gammaproteobacteria bacterium]
SFFGHAFDYYPPGDGNRLFLFSLLIFETAVTTFLLGLVCFRHTIKPVLIVILIASAPAAYFMDTYNNVFDHTMIQNMVNTDPGEMTDLLSLKQLVYLFLLGILPAALIYKLKIEHGTLKAELLERGKLLLVTMMILVVVPLLFSKYYASFFREHRAISFYANPVYYIYSTGKYLNSSSGQTQKTLTVVGDDAKISPEDHDRELIIMVLGETARADRFSLNGYHRETNPLLKKEDIINFSNVYACGTSTAISVPCMFSFFHGTEYSNEKAASTENLLDILKRAGVHILWRDNNSDSKGVALRVPYEDFRTPEVNPICDIECRDEGMLANLQAWINKHPTGDIFIVLHQFGNHGPAYYKRYPKSYERFTPVCTTNELKDCSSEQINNAYDNAILYTDYFLAQVIKLLKANSKTFETAMFYISDHGESLGENGLYLHGFPYLIAPNTQLHVPAILWLGEGMTEDIDKEGIKRRAGEHFSHDNVFHTVLGFMEIQTRVYDPKQDILLNMHAEHGEKHRGGKYNK